MRRAAVSPLSAPGLLPLVGFYVLYVGSTGIILPFLPPYLASRGLSPAQVGVLLALTPCLTLVGPPLWGHLADRTGRTDRVLRGIALGTAAAFSALLWTDRFPLLLGVMAAYGLFSSGITPLIDSLTLHRVSAHGGAYAHVRLFGSLGFIAASASFGLARAQMDHAAVALPLVLMLAYGLWTWSLGGGPAVPVYRPSPLAGLALLRQRDVALFLGATTLHWLACAPYNGVLGIHLHALGLSPAVLGATAGLGVAAEVVVMALYPRFAERLAPRHLLALAFGASALRWLGMALTSRAEVILALALLHAFTFGAFYVAAVAFMARRVPPSLLASGQALFASATFGIGGLVGYAACGRGYELLGGHRLFGVAALLELVALVLVLGMAPSPRARAPA